MVRQVYFLDVHEETFPEESVLLFSFQRYGGRFPRIYQSRVPLLGTLNRSAGFTYIEFQKRTLSLEPSDRN